MPIRCRHLLSTSFSFFLYIGLLNSQMGKLRSQASGACPESHSILCPRPVSRRTSQASSIEKSLKMRMEAGFPGGSAIKDRPAYAGDAGSVPGRGRFHPRAVERLSPCTTAIEALL